MKPLATSGAASALLGRIEEGKGAMLRAIDIIGPQTISLTLSVQDRNRGFDWIDLTFEMSGMNDARLVDDGKLKFVDTDDGITILFEAGLWGVGIGRYRTLDALKDAPLFLTGSTLKYAETPFSG